jgi:hypothetical protein
MKHLAWSAVLLALVSCSEAGDFKIKEISKGKEIAPKDYLVPGHVVLLDFGAPW